MRGDGALARRPQANHALADQRPREDSGSGHGTQKPVECMKRPIENNCSPGPGGLRAVLRLRHHHHRRRDDRPRLPRHRARSRSTSTSRSAAGRPSPAQAAHAGGERRSFAEVADAARRRLRDGAAMAQRGRKPKPIAAKIAAGNPGKRSLTTLVPAPSAGRHALPAGGAAERARVRATGRCIWPTRRRAI